MTSEVLENLESNSQRVRMCMSGVLSASTRGNLLGGVLYLAGRASAVKCSSEMTSGVHFKARRMKGVYYFRRCQLGSRMEIEYATHW